MAELLRAHGLARSYDSVTVFTDLSFSLNRGAKVGLVGPNGAGKTTLVRLLAGVDQPDAGQIILPQPITVAYLPQEPVFSGAASLVEAALAVASASVPGTIDVSDAAMVAQTRKVLAGLGFSQSQQAASAARLSGGERTRLCLAGLLLARADLLLLDEPTNHLDVDALEWLEDFVKRTPAAVLVVSHDRYFLDRIADGILELENGRLTQYSGNYSAYVAARDAARRRQTLEYEEYQRTREMLRRQIRQQMQWSQTAHAQATAKLLEVPKQKAYYRTKAGKRARVGKAKQRALERLESDPRERPRERRGVNLEFAAVERAGDEILRLNGVSKGFGGRTLFRDVSLVIRHGERVALVGPNGSGKTTLLRIALGLLLADAGAAAFGATARPGYLAQQLEQLAPEQTLTGQILAAAPGLSRTEVRTVLGCFLFGDNDVNRPVATLSTGEKVRLALATLMISGGNCLVLDEPTNHLDLMTRERVEEALAEYDGTLIVVSHDRYLLRKLATRVLAIEAGRVRDYPGDYAYYLAKRNGGQPGGDEDLLVLENRLSVLAAELGRRDCEESERAQLESEFVAVSRRVAALKRRQGALPARPC
ncbi:MAG: ribosomal protection-like ABC-F family protein [Chloroflexota bacterium]